jgi:hypothetical protein
MSEQTKPAKSSKFPTWAIIVVSVIVGFFLLITAVGFFLSYSSSRDLSGLDGGEANWAPGSEGFGGSVVQDSDKRLDSPSEDGIELPVEPDAAPTDEKERMVIKSASINSVVDNLDDAGTEAKKLTEKYGGYIIGYTKYDDTQYATESVTVSMRVPADKFEDLVDDLEALGRVTFQQTQGDDVTDEYVDLKSKLKNLEASEAQYLKIMQQATKVTEILEVQRELTNVRSEIEVLKGRMLYLEKSADLSTVSITFSLEERSQEVVDDTWDPQGTMANALRALVDTFQFFADSLIYIVILSPVVLVPLALIYTVIRLRKKAKNKV